MPVAGDTESRPVGRSHRNRRKYPVCRLRTCENPQSQKRRSLEGKSRHWPGRIAPHQMPSLPLLYDKSENRAAISSAPFPGCVKTLWPVDKPLKEKNRRYCRRQTRPKFLHSDSFYPQPSSRFESKQFFVKSGPESAHDIVLISFSKSVSSQPD